MVRSVLFACACLSAVVPFHIPAANAEAGSPVLVSAPAAPAANPAPVTGAPLRAPVALRIGSTEIVGQLTGRNSPNDTASRWRVYGTDLGHMILHRGALYMVFGDTYGPAGMVGDKDWRSNTMARIADPDPRNGFRFETMIEGPDGRAKELLPSRKFALVEKTIIPTYGLSLGGRMYLHYMSVRYWGDHGRWNVGHSGIAYSDDDGQNWVKPSEAVWPDNIGFEQVAFVLHEGTVYSFGIPEGRYGGVRLRRVAPKQILERNAYRYWNGAQWVAEAAAATTIVPAPVGEFSVAWSTPHRQWLMMYFEPKLQAVVLRTAPRLTGPWGDVQVVTSAQRFPSLYAPYIVPGTEIGDDLYYTMSLWTPYNVFLMRTKLEQTRPAPGLVSDRGPSSATGGNGTSVAGQD